jgi:hypothetical protein
MRQNRRPLAFIAPWSPRPSTPPYLAPNRPPPPLAGGSHVIPPISSPWGSILGPTRQNRRPLAFIAPWAPRPSTPPYLAPNRPPPPLAGGSHVIPPISSPWGSILGPTRQNRRPLAFIAPWPPRPSTPPYLAPNRSPPPPAGDSHVIPPISSPWGSILGIARQTRPLLAFIAPWSPRPLTRPYLAPNRSPPPTAGGSHVIPPISSPWGSILGSARQTRPLLAFTAPWSPRPSIPPYLARNRSPPPLAGGCHVIPPISSPWGSILGPARQTRPLLIWKTGRRWYN